MIAGSARDNDIAATSEPASGSVSANAAIASPVATRGRYWFFRSSDPASVMADNDMAATSEPASGSVSANAAMASPFATRGRYWFFRSSEPASVIGTLPRPCIVNAKSASPL